MDWNEDEFAFMNPKLSLNLKNIQVDTVGELEQSFSSNPMETGDAVGSSGYVPTKVMELLKPIFETPEMQLRDRVLSLLSSDDEVGVDKGSPEIVTAFEKFAANAVSFEGPNLKEHNGDRERDIVLVLGSSGSGKTLFSMLGFPAKSNEKVTIYFKMTDVSDRKDILGKQLVDTLKRRLGRAASNYNENARLNMTVSLVLDEAAVEAKWIGDKKNLADIYEKLASITEYPRLIVAGTGIDVETSGLSSTTDVRKYRMRPWGTKEIAAAIDKRGFAGDTKERLMSILQSQAIYRKLATNARSASYLIDELEKVSTWDSQFTSVSGVIQMVVRKYISEMR